jgi:hypothetical protein
LLTVEDFEQSFRVIVNPVHNVRIPLRQLEASVNLTLCRLSRFKPQHA